MDQLLKIMQELPNDVDCAMVSSDVNRRYLTGFSSSAGVLVITHNAAYLLVDFRYYEMAVSRAKGFEVILFKNLYDELEKLFCELNCCDVAIEIGDITVEIFNKYRKRFKSINFITDGGLDAIISRLRMTKSAGEVEKIKSAQEVADAAFSHILSFISPGKTELEIARRLNGFIMERSDGLSFETIVVSGKNSSLPHGTPSSKQIQKGDFITMDFGALVDGYHSDMTRTIFCGKPSDDQKKLYDLVLFGQNLALDAVRSGAMCCDIDDLVRKYFNEFGFNEEFGHGLGHGVGLSIHEKPSLSPKESCKLSCGMVVTVEPGLYLSGKYGVRIEDMVLVCEKGCENLTKSPKELICV